MPDESADIALEHFVWARSQGFSNDEILEAVGLHATLAPSDSYVVKLLAAAQSQLLDSTRQAA